MQCIGRITYRYYQNIIRNVKCAASECLVMAFEGLVVLTCDHFVSWVNVDTFCLHVIALYGRRTLPSFLHTQCQYMQLHHTHAVQIHSSGNRTFQQFAELKQNMG